MERALATLIRSVGAIGLSVVALGACGSNTSKPAASGSTSTSSSTSSSSAAPSTTASLSTVPPPIVEGRTEWSDATAKWKQLAPAAFRSTPEIAANDLAALLRGGDTSEVGQVDVASVQGGEPAVVVIRETGIPDDSVAAVDYEITLEPGDEGWVVSKARVQYSCRRGVDVTDATRCV